ncbi:MAG: alpha/beta fold hydrolase [Patescibacteria group bacterium]
MNKSKVLLGAVIILFFIAGVYFLLTTEAKKKTDTAENAASQLNMPGDEGRVESDSHPLSIESLRKGEYPGSEIVIGETLGPGSNYQRYIVSYKSEGLKIFALLTVPNGTRPVGGWPAIVFNHGYIPPSQYKTTERYISYTDGFSRNGYVLLRPDYRGHGNSEGTALGGYGSNGYTIDVLNAVSSLKKLEDPLNVNSQKLIVDANRIGMWGHSMGGFITIRNMVVSRDVKAGVIWGGVVASYTDLLRNWRRGASAFTPPPLPSGVRRWRQSLIERYGEPEKNPQFWNSISANSYLSDISGPIQLHHGEEDGSVPVEFSRKLNEQLKTIGKEVELFIYPGDDHDITSNFGTAMQRSVEFFDRYLK